LDEKRYKAVIESAPVILLNELRVHRVSESHVNEKTEADSAQSLRTLICYEIHGHAGANRQIKEIENKLLPYSRVLVMYQELCVVARNLKCIKDSAVEQEILEHRIPLFPKITGFIPKRKKKTKKR
jgi:hypothetical protein